MFGRKVIGAEWLELKQQGQPPSKRFGHSMSHLACNNALLVVGGRNDELLNSTTPFLNDVHLFLLDQKAWIQVKYTPFSERLLHLGNHSSCVLTNSHSFEKTVIFGGITYSTMASSQGPREDENTFKKP
jgi:hypothetical protein